MKHVTINERAAAMAMDFVVGHEARSDIEDLYSVLDQVERAASAESYAAGWLDGHQDGYSEATYEYDCALGRDEQSFYEGDSGDETTYRGRQPGETQFVRDVNGREVQFTRTF
jgi:hypothetical protein